MQQNVRTLLSEPVLDERPGKESCAEGPESLPRRTPTMSNIQRLARGVLQVTCVGTAGVSLPSGFTEPSLQPLIPARNIEEVGHSLPDSWESGIEAALRVRCCCVWGRPGLGIQRWRQIWHQRGWQAYDRSERSMFWKPQCVRMKQAFGNVSIQGAGNAICSNCRGEGRGQRRRLGQTEQTSHKKDGFWASSSWDMVPHQS